MTIRTEHRRLSHLFGLLLAAGCSSQEMPADATAPADTTVTDTTTDPDSTMPVDVDAGKDVFCGVNVSLLYPDGSAAADADAEADPGCEYSFPCGIPDGAIIIGCDLYQPGSGPLDARAFGCWIVEGSGCSDGQVAPVDGNVIVDCKDCLGGVGRGSEGVAALDRVRAKNAFAAWLAKLAHDEAASVWAFERFERELRRHGAPGWLLREARRARRDEIRHARTMTKLARRFGGAIAAPRIRRSRRVRSLEAIAVENAVEGCVNETFGALVAMIQSRTIAPELRSIFARIAADETRHAALARAAARWMGARLSPASRTRVAAAKSDAIAALVAKDSVAEVARLLRGGTPALTGVLAA